MIYPSKITWSLGKRERREREAERERESEQISPIALHGLSTLLSHRREARFLSRELRIYDKSYNPVSVEAKRRT